MFKIPQIFYWHVIVASPRLIEDIRKARDDELSLDEMTRQVVTFLIVEWLLCDIRPSRPSKQITQSGQKSSITHITSR